jgi:hypothetical protein
MIYLNLRLIKYIESLIFQFNYAVMLVIQILMNLSYYKTIHMQLCKSPEANLLRLDQKVKLASNYQFKTIVKTIQILSNYRLRSQSRHRT